MFKFERVLKSGDNVAIIEAFLEMLPSVIVSHNLMRDNDTALSKPELVEVIEQKLELFMHMLVEYKAKVLFTQGKKSGES
jgi:hypothetical protein